MASSDRAVWKTNSRATEAKALDKSMKSCAVDCPMRLAQLPGSASEVGGGISATVTDTTALSSASVAPCRGHESPPG